MVLSQIIIGSMLAASLQLAPPSSPQPKTVQISIDANATVLMTTSKGKQIGFDSQSNKSVNDIPEARIVERENASTFILPYDKTAADLYNLAISGKDLTQTANISMTGPGFVIGVRNLVLSAGEIQSVSLSTGESHDVLISALRDGPTPTLFLTTQSDRTQPSYRFEVSSSFLSRTGGMWIEVDMSHRWLFFGSSATIGSSDRTKSSFKIMMRRTNPGGSRETYTQSDVSPADNNNYRMDFGEWDGKGEIRFCYTPGSVQIIKDWPTRKAKDWPKVEITCKPLKNDTATKPN